MDTFNHPFPMANIVKGEEEQEAEAEVNGQTDVISQLFDFGVEDHLDMVPIVS